MPEDTPTAEQAAQRFKLATRIEALARGTQTIAENLGTAGDDLVVEALEKLKNEVEAVIALAVIVQETSSRETAEQHPRLAASLAETDRWAGEGGQNV